MATMTVRSTYALDPETALTIRELATQWNASQAEVIRRSVRIAAGREDVPVKPKMTAAQIIDHWRNNPPPRTAEQSDRLVAEMDAIRHEGDELYSEKLDRFLKP
jgi:hypothetical protein